MVSYRYTADDPNGARVDGHLEADSVQDARRQLEADGFHVLEVMEADASGLEGPPRRRLTSDESRELVENVAQLSTAELPLAPGLRAVADECDSAGLARALCYLADQLDQGRPLDEVLESSKDFLPSHVSGLIRAAAGTGHLGPALTELAEHGRQTTELRRGIWEGLAYPLFVAGLTTAVLIPVVVFIGGAFRRIFEDFGMELPLLSLVFFAGRRLSVTLLPVVVILVVILAIVARWRLGRADWQRWLASAPVVGPLWHWLCLLEWIGLLRVLVQNGMTLIDALRLSADGVSSVNVGQISQSLAEGVARGRDLSQMIESQPQIPASLVPLVRWGEETGGLAESLAMGQEMLEDRVRMRSLWLRAALPPILFIAIGSFVVFVIMALMGPLISLISNLSG